MPELEDLLQLGFKRHQEGKLEEAECAYREALEKGEGNAEIYNLYSVLKLQLNDIDTALEYAKKAVQIDPQAYYYETLCQGYIRNKDYYKIAELEELINKSFPQHFPLIFNLALAFKNLNENRKAVEYYEKALEIDSDSYQAWFNLAHLYSVEAETQKAVDALKKCLEIRPDDIDTEYFLSLALMRTKDYNNGLRYFERRLCRETAVAVQNKTYPNKARFDNIWKGEDISDKTLYVYYEAGFGDTIMFSRYLQLASRRCFRLIFMPHKQLAPLFLANDQLEIDEIVDKYLPETDIDFDVHAPLLSLPYIMGLKDDRVFFRTSGYLQADESKCWAFREKYFNNIEYKIGIKWQGNTYYDQDRVIPTEAFIPLTKTKNTQFYSFQTFEGSEEVSKLENVIDIGKNLTDFSQTAAALNNLDLVICNDTSLAHLAGAMGIPCWVILPYEVNWRWHTDLSKCDWYDSVRLFRQKTPGDWQSVFVEIQKELESITLRR